MSENGYKTAFKGTSLFGGVQIITIIVSIIKSKLVALWLGATGFGILGLFNSTITTIFSIVNLGLSSSTVRDIALVKDDKALFSKTIKSLKFWFILSGCIGIIFTALLSRPLSIWVFKTTEYTLSFLALSIIILLMSITQFNNAVLQGTQKLSYLVKSNILSLLLGLLISIPLFYFLDIEGIVLSLILSALIQAIVSFFFYKKIKIEKTNSISIKQKILTGTSTLRLGIMMAISGISVSVVELIVKAYITNLNGLDAVGLYQAGWSLNATYLGLVFTAMATDYFPRLSTFSEDNILIKKNVNQQAEIALLFLGPLIIIMLTFLPLIIKILYTTNFLSIIPMTRWLLIGSLLKAGSWAISYIFLAKGDGKTYLFNELGIKFINLPAYLLGYFYFDLEGIGYAYLLNYIVYFLLVSVSAYKKYQFKYNISFWKELIFFLLFSFATLFFMDNWIIKIIIITFVTTYSGYLMNKKVGILHYIRTFLKK